MDAKQCTACERRLPLAEFHRDKSRHDGLTSRCRRCNLASARRWATANPEKNLERSRAWRSRNPGRARVDRLARYSLTEERHKALLDGQGGRCAICRSDSPGSRDWAIDHDHRCCPRQGSCGSCVRGLLCDSCNVGLGRFGDDPDVIRSALHYLTGGES